ncbi:uncharacterized protein LOC110734915 [Chenopodium quinoa]|uniref:uncharacterized protein LOC110734915 n=1 Tax=Chenopodium quinoa TaxID=63459 RepID=UPI000B78FCB3|nr:uncharacterized protein LOC110734915 [Chenopodium quinoa]
MIDGELPRVFPTQQANKFNVYMSTLSRLFKSIKQKMNEGNVIDVRSTKLRRCCPKPREYSDDWLMLVPLYNRTTERSYATALKISRVTLHNLRKKGRLKTHKSSNHSALTSNHKIARIKWALAHINPILADANPTFVDMQQVIHSDEKWFYLNLKEISYYIQESMGYFFVYTTRAKKKGKNREAGTLETENVQSVNKVAITKMLMKHIIPAIQTQWLESLPKDVIIQWDNAKPHQIPMDDEFRVACQTN